MSETILTFNIRDSVEAHSFHINDQPSQAFRPGKKKQKTAISGKHCHLVDQFSNYKTTVNPKPPPGTTIPLKRDGGVQSAQSLG